MAVLSALGRGEEGAWDAESRGRGKTKSFIRKDIKIPVPKPGPERELLSTGRKHPGRGLLHQHFLGAINRINIHRGPGRSQVILLSMEEEGTWGPALLLAQRQGAPRSNHIKS